MPQNKFDRAFENRFGKKSATSTLSVDSFDRAFENMQQRISDAAVAAKPQEFGTPLGDAPPLSQGAEDFFNQEVPTETTPEQKIQEIVSPDVPRETEDKPKSFFQKLVSTPFAPNPFLPEAKMTLKQGGKILSKVGTALRKAAQRPIMVGMLTPRGGGAGLTIENLSAIVDTGFGREVLRRKVSQTGDLIKKSREGTLEAKDIFDFVRPDINVKDFIKELKKIPREGAEFGITREGKKIPEEEQFRNFLTEFNKVLFEDSGLDPEKEISIPVAFPGDVPHSINVKLGTLSNIAGISAEVLDPSIFGLGIIGKTGKATKEISALQKALKAGEDLTETQVSVLLKLDEAAGIATKEKAEAELIKQIESFGAEPPSGPALEFDKPGPFKGTTTTSSDEEFVGFLDDVHNLGAGDVLEVRRAESLGIENEPTRSQFSKLLGRELTDEEFNEAQIAFSEGISVLDEINSVPSVAAKIAHGEEDLSPADIQIQTSSPEAVKTELHSLRKGEDLSPDETLPKLTREDVEKQIDELGLPKEQATAQKVLFDARAKAWAQQTGRPAQEWYSERIAGIKRSLAEDVPGAIRNEPPDLIETAVEGDEVVLNESGELTINGRVLFQDPDFSDPSKAVYQVLVKDRGGTARRPSTGKQVLTSGIGDVPGSEELPKFPGVFRVPGVTQVHYVKSEKAAKTIFRDNSNLGFQVEASQVTGLQSGREFKSIDDFKSDILLQANKKPLQIDPDSGDIIINDIEAIKAKEKLLFDRMKRAGFDLREPEEATDVFVRIAENSDGRISADLFPDHVRVLNRAFNLDIADNVLKVKNLNSKAARSFGLTNDFREAGYIQPNGNLLDFSGKREGGMAGDRAFDHREINRVFEDETIGMEEFMEMGNIRMFPESGGVDIAKAPTSKQTNKMRAFFESMKFKGNSPIVEAVDGERRFYKEYPERTNPQKPITDIAQFYEGKKTDGDVLFQRPQEMKKDASPIFYSTLRNLIEDKLPGKTDIASLKGLTKNIKKEEMFWSGLDDFMAAREGQKVTKDEVLDFLKENQIRIEETVKGIDVNERNRLIDARNRGEITTEELELRSAETEKFGPAKFGEYQLAGGDNYKEMLLRLPVKQPKRTRIDVTDDVAMQGMRIRRIKRPDGQVNVRLEIEGVNVNEITRFEGTDQEFMDEVSGINRLVGGPTPAPFRSQHFEEPNVIAHTRFNDRFPIINDIVERMLNLEEMQSDWIKQGRKHGFRTETITKLPDNYTIRNNRSGNTKNLALARFSVIDENGVSIAEQADEISVIHQALRTLNRTDAVPNAPFKSTWHEMTMRRMIRYAADNNYDRISWTTGKQQVDRYEEALRNAVDRIEWTKTDKGVQIKGFKNGSKVVDTVERENSVSDAIGKSMAETIKSSPNQKGIFEGSNIKIDDTGMASFYDKILVNYGNKFGKKFGSKVEDVKIGKKISDRLKAANESPFEGRRVRPNSLPETTVHSMKITEEMKRSVRKKGVPLFQDAKGAVEFLDGEQRAIIYIFEGGDFSTILHETGHIFRRELTGGDLAKAEKWAGVKDGNWTTGAEEKFARGFERFLREGEAPNSELKKIFEQFKEWLTEIYKVIKGSDIDVKLNDNIRQVFDNLLGGKELGDFTGKRTVRAPRGQADVSITKGVVEKNKEGLLPFKVTSARKADIAKTREQLGLTELNTPERKSWETSLSNAKSKKLDEKALRLSDEVIENPRAFDDEETAGVVIKASDLKNEHLKLSEELSKLTDEADIKIKSAEIQRVEEEFDKVSRALKMSGTEKGRALAAQKLTIDQDFSLVSIKSRAKAASGKSLTEKQNKQFGELVSNLNKKIDEMARLEKKASQLEADKVFGKTPSQKLRKMNRLQKNEDLAKLTARAKKLIDDGCLISV